VLHFLCAVTPAFTASQLAALGEPLTRNLRPSLVGRTLENDSLLGGPTKRDSGPAAVTAFQRRRSSGTHGRLSRPRLFHVTPRKGTSDVIEPFQTHRQNDARRRVICRRWSTTASGDLTTVATRQRPQGPVDAALKQPLFCATVCSPTSLLHSRLDTNLWLNCRGLGLQHLWTKN
jgi:hypothetical protein